MEVDVKTVLSGGYCFSFSGIDAMGILTRPGRYWGRKKKHVKSIQAFENPGHVNHWEGKLIGFLLDLQDGFGRQRIKSCIPGIISSDTCSEHVISPTTYSNFQVPPLSPHSALFPSRPFPPLPHHTTSHKVPRPRSSSDPSTP